MKIRTFGKNSTTLRLFLCGLVALVVSQVNRARAWDVIDKSTGTNYVTHASGFSNEVYYAVYAITNNTASPFTNVWIKLGDFTNGSSAKISLAPGGSNKRSLGDFGATSQQFVFFCMQSKTNAMSETNGVSVYIGDPDNGGILLTNRVFTNNWVVAITGNAGSSYGTSTNYLSTGSPRLGGTLQLTTVYKLSNNAKSGLVAFYPAVSNNWDASTFTVISNYIITGTGTTYTNQMLYISTGNDGTSLTNVCTFRINNTKATATQTSAGGYYNATSPSSMNYLLPTAGTLNPIPGPTNAIVLTNFASVSALYTNTTVWFTNTFYNNGPDATKIADLICTLPPGFIYAGQCLFTNGSIAAPLTNATAATNYVLSFTEGYWVSGNSSASLVFSAMPTNAVTSSAQITNRIVVGTYTSYGLIGTNQLDKTFPTSDDAKPSVTLNVEINPIAVADSFSVLEDGSLSVPARGVLTNDIEPNFFTTNVASFTAAGHGTVNVNSDGSFTCSPTGDYNGSDSFTYTITNGNGRTSTATVSLTVTPVNDPPSFTKGANKTVLEDAGAQTFAGWATSISAGPIDEGGQSLTFHVSNDNTALFSAQPAISSAGTLTFTPATDANGSATVSVYLTDDGGVSNGGNDTSGTQTFTITLTAVNDTPSFTKGEDQTVLEDAGAQSISIWATIISAGPSDESSQTLIFHVSNDNNSLFSAQPAVSSSGTLTYTPAANANGSATVSIYLSDSGLTANGGSDTSGTQTFTITVTAVNDPPTLTSLGSLTLNEDAGLQTVNLGGIAAGPANESAQSLTVAVSSSITGLIPTPSVTYTSPNSTGSLTFTPTASTLGVSTISVVVQDDGGVANHGVDAVTNTFTVTVNGTTNSLAAAGSSALNVTNATGSAGAGYSQNAYTGILNVSATSGSPFTISLASFNGANAGLAANFDADGTFTWTFATTTRGVTGFSADKFAIDTTSFGNDLAGGSFSVQLSGDSKSLNLVFTPNHAPVASEASYGRAWGTALRIPVSQLLASFTSDADGDVRGLVLTGSSTNGASVGTNATFILFAPTNNFSERFQYTVRDLNAAYRAGDTVRLATNWLVVAVTNAVSSQSITNNAGGSITLNLAGVPGYAYVVERANDLAGPWTTLDGSSGTPDTRTNAPAGGLWQFTETPPYSPAFYRTRQNN